MKTVIKAMALTATLAGAVFSQAGYAADINRTSALDLSLNTVDFGDAFNASTSGKTFSDLFTFTVPTSSSLDSALVSIHTQNALRLNIDSFNLINTATSSVVATGVNIPSGPLATAWSLASGNFGPGSYALEVDGKVLGGSGGSFGGNANISPVPEPSAVSLMLSGVGLLGLMVARNRKSNL